MHKLRSTANRGIAAAVIVTAGALGAGLLVPLVSAADTGARADSQAIAVAKRTLVAKEGFEKGKRGWATTNRASVLQQVRGGHAGSKHAALVKAPRSRGATIGMTSGGSLVSRTARGQVYQAQVWLKASKTALRGRSVVARLEVVERSSKGSHARSWRKVGINNGGWHRVTVPLTARGDGHRLALTVTALHVRAKGAVRVDNVTVHRSPRPQVGDQELLGTMFGASVDDVSGDWTKALRNADKRYSRLDTVRVFDPDLPGSWDGRLGATNRPLVYSFRARPTAVLAGIYDRDIRRWFRQAPDDWPIWWAYNHEPEDDIERGDYGAGRYRAAWQHVYELSKAADNPMLRPTLVLMCWTLSPNSGRQFSDYYPGSFIRVLSWDCYNSSSDATSYKEPAEIFSRAVAKSHDLGKGFAVSEFGSRLVPGDDGSRRAAWLASIARYTARSNAVYVTYWDATIPAGNFKLRDFPSIASWRSIVSAN